MCIEAKMLQPLRSDKNIWQFSVEHESQPLVVQHQFANPYTQNYLIVAVLTQISFPT